ncbi:MAG: polysulfide reductase NrfD [Deltaproteobacteria bacterium]|nr:polysulfide reductase NrfD [Deltaproteobacteria bacterium]
MTVHAAEAVLDEPPIVTDGKTVTDVTEDVCRPVERGPTIWWFLAFGVALAALIFGAVAVYHTVTVGIGTWGLNRTIGWAFDITNFVFWVGIGHAGTLISAILLLFRQKWRMSIARAAEAMTIFAVCCAGLFPILHMGRPWLGFWNIPYPNSRALWVNFRSPLLWDVFAISTYLIISAVFWYVGLVPDLATVRDRAKGKVRKFVYGLLSLGWDGSARTWARYEVACLLLAGLAAPLVVSVHSVVSFDFATSLLPGWHATIFPPYFVTGAIFSGFAMVLTLLIITRKVLGIQAYITIKHLENMCKVILVTGMLVGLAYGTEMFIAFYSGNEHERFVFMNRATGPMAWSYWIMVGCNVLSPQILWFKRARTSVPIMFVVSILVNVGMWFERFVIIVTTLHRDFLPANWSSYSPTWTEVGMFVGSFGLFFTLFLLFVRVAPVVAMAEVKSILHARPHHDAATETKEARHVEPKEVHA